MADRSKFEEMLERLINEDKDGAQELFHEIVVEKSREIYEGLLEDEEVEESEDEDEDKEKEVEEASDEEVEEDEELEEDFDLDEFEVEADDDMMGGDPADDMMGDIEGDDDMDMDMDMGDEEGEEDMEDRVDDLEDALDELKAEFEKLMSGDEGEEADDDMDMDMDDEEEEKESFEFESTDEEVDEASDEEVEESDDDEVEEASKSPSEEMREYVEKVAGGGLDAQGSAKMGDNGANTKSAVAGKNDMGGTASNLNQSKDEKGTEAGKGAIQGSSLADTSAKPMSTKNVNEPGSKTATNMNAVSGGHGAEKKGKPETADKGAQSTLNKVSTRAK